MATSGIKSMILQSVLYATTNQQPLLCPSTATWQCSPTPSTIIAAPDNFNPDIQIPPLQTVPELTAPIVTPLPLKPKPTVTPEKPAIPSPTTSLPRLTQEADQIAAERAWKYFERNWNPQTGLVNSVDNLPWTTWWDQGSALLGIHAAYQLGLLPQDVFQKRMNTLLQTLEKLPLPATGLPNKAYSTRTAQMRQLNDTPDPKGTSGWSALDMARFLLGLHVMRSHYPEYSDSPKGDSFASRINRIVARWHTSKLVKDGWLNGAIPRAGKLLEVQEGRLGYEQYAAHSLKLWNIQASKALSNPPIKTVEIDGIKLQIDERNFKNSGATNYLTNDPYLLWGLEIGWNDAVKPQVQNLFKVQQQRFKRTGILTAVNEDSLDRPPYFLYYSVYSNGQSWQAVNTNGKAYPQLRFVSTKAAFSWFALMPDDPYSKRLRDFAQNLSDKNRGYLSGRYENSKLGVNASVDINTNAIVLESLLYQARGRHPLVLDPSEIKN
ncbi:MAG: DUF3131 domain-containing protein [Nostoc sp. ChiQUE02]|uniref:DUF3131 domain-containing protein n=1 Tax=Nostoc sp. ChiQUE02 TaxID=3075377 RepID=UPI002AD2F8FF|nr:DUF3131 domain-containing protein [Nostoc sp. ChiQUE02]MDZ8229473.1 DUF3131 domain-containing protein [Nostoc sp. ChiQUE02]